MILNCLNYWWYLSVLVIFLFVMCFAATHAVGEAYVMESCILPGWRNLLRGFSTISGMLLRSSTRLKYVSQFSNATTEGQKMLYFSWPFCYNISRMQYCYEHWPATNRQSSLRMLLASLIHTHRTCRHDIVTDGHDGTLVYSVQMPVTKESVFSCFLVTSLQRMSIE